MLECKMSAKANFCKRGRRSFTCSAQEYCASGAKSVHAAGAELLGEAPGTGLEAGLAGGLAAGVELLAGVMVGVGLVEGVVPRGQRLQVAAQYPPSGAPATNMKGSPHLP